MSIKCNQTKLVNRSFLTYFILTMKNHLENITSIIREQLLPVFGAVRIVDVKIREDVDENGERILLVDVVFAANPNKLNARALAGAVRQVRPSLIDNNEKGFPVFTFIAQNEVTKASRVSQKSH
jgi:hypothetical protein